jgi:hypothetical protein
LAQATLTPMSDAPTLLFVLGLGVFVGARNKLIWVNRMNRGTRTRQDLPACGSVNFQGRDSFIRWHAFHAIHQRGQHVRRGQVSDGEKLKPCEIRALRSRKSRNIIAIKQLSYGHVEPAYICSI